MGLMKDFDRRIRQGGDDAIAAVTELWEARWIPVGERLPKDEAQVLVYCIPRDDDGTPSCAGCDGHGGIINTAWYERLGDGDGEHWVSDGPAPPLFWMPLPAWIPVGERLPDADDRVLISCPQPGEIVGAAIDKAGLWTCDDGQLLGTEEPTHWMPLPALPTDAK